MQSGTAVAKVFPIHLLLSHSPWRSSRSGWLPRAVFLRTLLPTLCGSSIRIPSPELSVTWLLVTWLPTASNKWMARLFKVKVFPTNRLSLPRPYPLAPSPVGRGGTGGAVGGWSPAAPCCVFFLAGDSRQSSSRLAYVLLGVSASVRLDA